ncbi:uncharacterized protein N7469_002251 [Penicillium citrinum]|uniref:Uncharacterized protein n=1 Tax=Penicillium citrinum TaxID=5077 RepID=A0A9W9PAA6_PENCI|nr:uncharacterized protein N7469_002251 [Penicillium citrinum]KAJ5240660.1 hypothetical protein N7469_002251 [Penicillium citrinum]
MRTLPLSRLMEDETETQCDSCVARGFSDSTQDQSLLCSEPRHGTDTCSLSSSPAPRGIQCRGITGLFTPDPPRSFLFAVVANVGPGGASRSLAVAYRQHHDKYNSAEAAGARVHHLTTDALALIDILSDPANRASLEAERALAEGWYRRSPHEPPVHERPSIPDTAQPPYVPCFERRVPVQQQAPLPWRDDTPSQFPFIATCVLLALLRDDRAADATGPGDVQFQPLSTVFRADCAEYGLVVLDISDLARDVQYGIAAFPTHYMATVWDPDENMDWDPVEDDQPERVDVVLGSLRPRVPLSMAQWVRKYYSWSGLEDHPAILRLEERPVADAATLDCADGEILDIWPPEREDLPPTSSEGSATVDEPPQNVPAGVDHTIDDLLVLTQEPIAPARERQALAHLQLLVPFREKLRQRLEAVPDRLGTSTISSHVLRVAYTEHRHLNLVMFGSLPPRVIAAAIASVELRGASSLSVCVNAWAGDGEEGASDLVDLAAALAQATRLQQICFLQRPDRNNDDDSTRIRDPASSPGAQVFPMIRLFTFLGPQREDIPDAAADAHVHRARPGYSACYSMDNTGLTAEDVAVRFLNYLRALGPYSDPEKAPLRMAYHGAFPSLASTADDGEQHRRQHGWSPPRRPPLPSPLRPSPDSLGVKPIPAGFFADKFAADDPSRVRLGDLPPGSWVVLVDRQARGARASRDSNSLRYSFLRVRQSGADLSPEHPSRAVEMVGGLVDFLRETVPGTDLGPWETRVEEVERDLVSAFTRPSPPSTPSSPDLTTMMERADESFRRAAEALIGMSAFTPPARYGSSDVGATDAGGIPEIGFL